MEHEAPNRQHVPDFGRDVAVARGRLTSPSNCSALPLRRNRWGVILAGGDGTRLQRLTKLVSGDDRPKQFCPLIGGNSLLDQTRRRAERCIPGQQILFPVTLKHQAFYQREPGAPAERRIVQPENKGTAPAILCSLLSIYERDVDALVAILPCDHHYTDEAAFVSALEECFQAAEQRQSEVVLMGAAPDRPETEYGWIELGSGGKPPCYPVQSFCEKPCAKRASELFEQGSLWNTFVMVGHVRAFLEMISGSLGFLIDEFRRRRSLWRGDELRISSSLFDRIPSLDFSREVLATQASRLLALPLGRRGGWTDLGHPGRVLAALRAAGLRPWWLEHWTQVWQSAEIA